MKVLNIVTLYSETALTSELEGNESLFEFLKSAKETHICKDLMDKSKTDHAITLAIERVQETGEVVGFSASYFYRKNEENWPWFASKNGGPSTPAYNIVLYSVGTTQPMISVLQKISSTLQMRSKSWLLGVEMEKTSLTPEEEQAFKIVEERTGMHPEAFVGRGKEPGVRSGSIVLKKVIK